MDRRVVMPQKSTKQVELVHGYRDLYSYRRDHNDQASKEAPMRRVREDWKSMGSFAHVSNLQHDSVLR